MSKIHYYYIIELGILTASITHHPSEIHVTFFLESDNKLLQTITMRNRCSTLFNIIREHMHLPSLAYITYEEEKTQECGGKSLGN